MNASAHKAMTIIAFYLLAKPEICGKSIYDKKKSQIVKRSWDTDLFNDLEFVNVRFGRDDPHMDEWDATNDSPSYSFLDNNYTAFNHFIDLKKGPGQFDDYDGYSYQNGSAKMDQYESLAEEAERQGYHYIAEILKKITLETNDIGIGIKFDQAMMWWFDDEYVHAPCHPWYQGCSPALERYSYFRDKQIYSSLKAELAARFPLSESSAQQGAGIPYSTFMPLDNLARYWFDLCVEKVTPLYMGSVLHAVQDASVPHHAAGYMGNGHSLYERKQENIFAEWFKSKDSIPQAYLEPVIALIQKWNRNDPNPPKLIDDSYKKLTPAVNWRIDQLVTWMAWNGYEAYTNVYKGFKGNWNLNDSNFENLTQLALAMSVLVMIKGNVNALGQGVIGNKHTHQMHLLSCKHLPTGSHTIDMSLSTGLSKNYDGCWYCLQEYDGARHTTKKKKKAKT